MLAPTIFIFCLVTSVVGGQVNPSCSQDVAPDDTLSFIQQKVETKSGTSHSKLKGEANQESKANEGTQSYLAVTSSMLSAGSAEFVAMTLFVFIGCGTACANGCGEGFAVFGVALSFGLAITALAYSIGHISGGQINGAVTFGLVLSGNLGWQQGLINFVFQLLGSICGSALTCVVFGDSGANKTDLTKGLGTNAVSPGFSWKQAMIAEIMGTFILVFTVLETAVAPGSAGNRSQACLAIGLSVFLAHCVLIRVDGCSINPTRSFGPMVVRKLTYGAKEGENNFVTDHWIFWVGPLIGAALAAGVYSFL